MGSAAQQGLLSGVHGLCLFRPLVVVPQQVEHAVDDQVGQFRLQGPLGLLGLALRHGEGDDHLTQAMHPVGRRHERLRRLEAEGEHVGRLIDTPVATVKVSQGVVVGDDQPQLGKRRHSLRDDCLPSQLLQRRNVHSPREGRIDVSADAQILAQGYAYAESYAGYPAGALQRSFEHVAQGEEQACQHVDHHLGGVGGRQLQVVVVVAAGGAYCLERDESRRQRQQREG
jgi:hypothetical protein